MLHKSFLLVFYEGKQPILCQTIAAFEDAGQIGVPFAEFYRLSMFLKWNKFEGLVLIAPGLIYGMSFMG